MVYKSNNFVLIISANDFYVLCLINYEIVP